MLPLQWGNGVEAEAARCGERGEVGRGVSRISAPTWADWPFISDYLSISDDVPMEQKMTIHGRRCANSRRFAVVRSGVTSYLPKQVPRA